MAPGGWGWGGITASTIAVQRLMDERLEMLRRNQELALRKMRASVHQTREWSDERGNTIQESWDENRQCFVRKVTTPEMRLYGKFPTANRDVNIYEDEAKEFSKKDFEKIRHLDDAWRYHSFASYPIAKCESCGSADSPGHAHTIKDKGKRLVSRCSWRQKRLEDNMRKLFWERGIKPNL